eukprot:GHRR01010713.1.p1 GENE.GHRR01010713.1~~GHRR01010713.1.p1  ORF type:complete len:316 (+),score=102.09 GHRR01010713.1:94-1041(+)
MSATITTKLALPPAHPTYDIKAVITAALAEDAGDRGDITTLAIIDDSIQATATFLAKANGTLAGLVVANLVFEMVDPSLRVTWKLQDGDKVQLGVEFGSVTGSARSILVAERISLNLMQRMSGIATATATMVAATAGHKARILDTRKTAPGLRLLDKWAVALGGGTPHRMGLFDMMMIKDNHIAVAGGIPQAIAAAEAYIQEQQLSGVCIEVETTNLAEVQQVLSVVAAGQAPHVTRIMLDNMTKLDPSSPGGVDVSLLKQAVALIAGKVETEASGNVTVQTVAKIASSGVDFISVGALTHSVKALDISLKIITQ